MTYHTVQRLVYQCLKLRDTNPFCTALCAIIFELHVLMSLSRLQARMCLPSWRW
jgi:hypothetical protein